MILLLIVMIITIMIVRLLLITIVILILVSGFPTHLPGEAPRCAAPGRHARGAPMEWYNII